MLKIGGWLGGGKSLKIGHTKSLNALDELAQIEDAMAAVTYIMADDVDGAEAHLNKGNSPFHQLGKGVVTFMRATLGFEQETMREASASLSEAENAAYEHHRRATRMPNAYQSPIYPVGTEYAVCLAEAQLMSAIVGVLNESLTEAIKGFYKLRKAYLTLEGVMDAEKNFLRKRSTSSLGSTVSAVSKTPTKIAEPPAPESKSKDAPISSSTKEAQKGPTDDDEDFDFVDADEEHKGVETPGKYLGHLKVPAEMGQSVELDNSKRRIDIQSSSAPHLPSHGNPSSVPGAVDDFEKLTLSNTAKQGEDISVYGTHPVDVFIISGSNFCFGILLLIISLVPPAFATLLKIVGFKGDKDRGIAMLWQASKFYNIHGAMAGLVLFGFYNVLSGMCDIVTPFGEGSYPKERCQALLADMRKRYPKSHLWLLEEARMMAADKELEKAVAFLASKDESALKQLEALSWFERSLNLMYLHDYEATAIAFEKCVTLNNWSHGLYYYVCGAAYLELYRQNKPTNAEAAGRHKAKAQEYFAKVMPNTGRKKFLAKQLPFDVFVNRKIQKWEARAKDWGCDLADAVGVSPIEEMIYFWNGYKRMRNEHLQTSLDNLAWSDSAANPHWGKEGLDEQGVLTLLRAAVLRNQGDTSKAREMLSGGIIANDKLLYKGQFKDSWTAPCARYEMAANLWKEAEGNPKAHMDKLEECKNWLEEVSRWDAYDLDARIGMKVTSGKATMRRFGIEC
ncbi:outer membrane protein Iml2/Tetratricopeptide repeat protein 39 [Massariosphaeria phaeospora]|uniref:Inclusion body clearance protein IML2 n=1 Tax=Massariosphaeria phaeospora TaxID=100035 RepID=A0A7C8I2Y7_9PLEO|nr:outer membrane protein Iml2/Tetratricopeptide repeat protein 39 [Massariosphaeria phaeospora]